MKKKNNGKQRKVRNLGAKKLQYDHTYCFWCRQELSLTNPSRTWYYPDNLDIRGAMTPVCGENCPERPEGAAVFDYIPWFEQK